MLRGRADAKIGHRIQVYYFRFEKTDSKKDDGESVLEWLSSQPELTSIPRERTGGGVHIHARCDDLPAFKKAGGKPYEKALVAPLNDQVTAELYFDGLNLVLSPCRL